MNKRLPVIISLILLILTGCQMMYRFNPNDPGSDNFVHKPENLKASDGISKIFIQLEWGQLHYVEKYLIFRSDSSSDDFSKIGETVNLIYDDTYQLNSNHIYYYKIKALLSTGLVTDESNVDTGFTAEIAPPQNVSATKGNYNDKIEISWDEVNTAEKYIVYKSDAYDGLFSTIGETNGLVYDDLSVDQINTSYHYKVKAYNSVSGYSLLSSSDSGYKTSNLVIQLGRNYNEHQYSINESSIKWFYFDGIAGNQYHIWWDNNEGSQTYDANVNLSAYHEDKIEAYFENDSTGYVQSQLITAALTEKVYIKVVETTGSNGGQFAIKVEPVMQAPPDFSATDGTSDQFIAVSWTAVPHSAKYYLYRATTVDGVYSEITTTALLLYNDTQAPWQGVNYFYKVKSYFSNTNEFYSDFSVIDEGYKTLAAPGGFTVSKGDSLLHVALSWNAVAGATNYEVDRSDAMGGSYSKIADTGTDNFFNDTSTTPGVKYYYKYRVISQMETGDYSTVDYGYKKLGTPVISATNADFTDKVQITWSGIIGADSYTVERATASGGPYSPIGTTTGISFDDNSADQSTSYYYKVRAYADDSAGYSDYSSFYNGYILSIPTGVASSDGRSQDNHNVTWNAISGATDYYIYRATTFDGVYSNIGSAASQLFWDNTSVRGKVYYYKVTAWNATAGETALSDWDDGYRIIKAPGGVSAADITNSTKIIVTWNTASGADWYRVYRSSSELGTYAQIGTSLTTSYDDSAVDHNTYWYKIKAHADSANIDSDFSSADSGVLGFYLAYYGNGNTSGQAPVNGRYVYGTVIDIAGNTRGLVKVQDGITCVLEGWNTAADGSGTPYDLGSGTITMGDSIIRLYAQWNVIRGTGPAGGYIFYDHGSVHADGWRYMEAAPSDQAPAIWGPDTTINEATSDTIGAGYQNTQDIVAAFGAGTYAAKICDDLDVNGYTDWFLPTRAEMIQMFTNLHSSPYGLGDFANANYWSSVKKFINIKAMYITSSSVPYSQGNIARSTTYRFRPTRRF